MNPKLWCHLRRVVSFNARGGNVAIWLQRYMKQGILSRPAELDTHRKLYAQGQAEKPFLCLCKTVRLACIAKNDSVFSVFHLEPTAPECLFDSVDYV